MLRIAEIQDSFRTLVGFEQPETGGVLYDSLTESDSGLTYQGRHALMTLDNVRSILPRRTADMSPEWDATTPYYVGQTVAEGNTEYICRVANTGQEPANSVGYWDEYDQLSEYLLKSVNGSIATVANKYVENKALGSTTKTLLEHKTLFDGAGRLNNLCQQTHSLVGYEIQPMKGMGVTTQIHRIGLQMTGATGAVTLYLFHSSSVEPIKTITLNVERASVYQWFSVRDLFLPYLSTGNTNSGGVWWLCYYEDALPTGMAAVNMVKDFSKDPCGHCGGGNTDEWRALTRYIRVSPFRVAVESDFPENPVLFDPDTIDYTPKLCYGMNLELSIGCDLTDFMIAQRSLFARAVQTQVVYDLLSAVAYNPNANVNRNQANVQRQDFLFELNGSTMTKSAGLKGELEKTYKALEINTEGIDVLCLPCRRRGVTYRGV